MDEKKTIDCDALEYFHDKLKGEFATPKGAADAAAANTYYVAATSSSVVAGSVSLTLPIPAIQGMSVRFESPCASGDIEAGITIDGVQYQWRNINGESIAGTADIFGAGAVVDIALDRNNVIAYYIGAAPVSPIISYPVAQPPTVRIPGRIYMGILADLE